MTGFLLAGAELSDGKVNPMIDRAAASDTEYLSMAALCERLNICRATAYRKFLAFGVKVGRVWRFDWCAIREHLELETDKEWPREDGA